MIRIKGGDLPLNHNQTLPSVSPRENLRGSTTQSPRVSRPQVASERGGAKATIHSERRQMIEQLFRANDRED
jgi:hypothetical protein